MVAVTFTAIRSSPVSTTGGSFLCIKGRILPLNGARVSRERFNLCWPLPHVVGFPGLGVLSASLTSVRPSGRPRVAGLSNPTPLMRGAWRISLVHMKSFDYMLAVQPRKHPKALARTHLGILPSPLRDKVGYFHPRSISGLFLRSLSFRPAASLSTLRSTRYRAPRKTRYTTAG